MKSIVTILLTLAAITAGTSATRADELSELVAAVAATVDTKHIATDIKKNTFDDKPRYRSKTKDKEVSSSLLDGLYAAMKRQTFRNMQKEFFGEEESVLPEWNYTPTLGKEFFRPVPGIITSKFGWRPQFQRVHHGIDLSLNIGDTVRAAISGTVERIAYDSDGYGHYVVMSHPDGMETVYGHLQYALVAQGQYVYAGQPVAIGGNTGNSTGPHLHFEARLEGVAVDPMLIFDFYGINRYQYEEPEPAKNHTPVYSHQSKSIKGKSTYIVRVGDTPESVARQAGISVMKLRQLNMLQEGQPLEVGRMLKII